MQNNIQWYPGHMTKAKRMMQENIKLIDIVIELLDARIPFSSRNPDIDVLANNKFRLVLLNKCDLADEKINQQWEAYFKEKGIMEYEHNRFETDYRNIKKERFAVAEDKSGLEEAPKKRRSR